MKNLVFILLLATSGHCFASQECIFETKKLTFETPKSHDIVNTFWQDDRDKDSDESIKRLFISYKDGSFAILEHKYCLMYNFEAAYYLADKSKLSSIKAIQAKTEQLLAYASIKDSNQHESIGELISTLNGKKFNAERNITSSAYGFIPAYGDSEYSINYFPLGDVSVHQAAFFVYMGIGGTH